jgi:uncharacterized membrane protein YphA (DoxX/SURF4 family)
MTATKPQSFAMWALRAALAATFLSAVADRFGCWGPPGAAGVAWGDWAHFQSYSNTLNGWLPSALQAFVAYAATAAEVVLGIALVALPKQWWVAAFSAALLCTFAMSMTVALGPKASLDYSVWVAASAAFLLAMFLRQPRRA